MKDRADDNNIISLTSHRHGYISYIVLLHDWEFL